jgi:energy-coupling factor transporter ATP-binding protein EcfA2
MQVTNLKYNQFKDQQTFWNLNQVIFERINLLVGKNASGKSKTLHVLNGLSNLLGENKALTFSEGEYDISFKFEDKIYEYILEYHDNIITCEKLILNGDTLIDRAADGKGRIKSSHGKFHDFEIPLNELKANRRDKSNYPYLEDLNFWANHVRLFNFSSPVGKSVLALKDPTKKPAAFDLKNTDGGVIQTFISGKTKHSEVFIKRVITDFNSIGFNIEDIELGSLTSVNFQIIENPNAVINALRVKEKDLDCWTDQFDMSNGMFRALSLIIHFNYYDLENIPGLILIDDIGEGLDFERASKLIEFIILKAETNNNIQIFMSTNDSFIMNSVDLKYWQIIHREGCQIKYYNNLNSSQIFEDYRFTGLNHFDFFASGFFKNGFIDEKSEN